MTDLATQVASLDRDKARSALAAVWQATVLGRPNRAANQTALAAAGGVMLLVDVVVQRLAGVRLEGGTSSCTREDEEEAVMALLVLENLSCNVLLHRDMVLGAPGPHLLRLLVALAKDNTAAAAIRVNAAKVLVNLTFSQIELAAAATEAGGLPAAITLLQAGQDQADTVMDAEAHVGLIRQGAWLLSHLTAGQGCEARELLAAQPDALARIKGLLTHSRDPTTLIRCCEVVCNLARGSVGPHAELMRAGLVPVLLKLVEEESGYISFAAALAALGLQQPLYTAAQLGKELEAGPHSALASAAYQVNTELLPVMRHDNARMVLNTCARLYQIAVCLRDSPGCRSVLSNTSLSLALTDLLRTQHSSVLQE
ncbi:hypothetical protein HXX76_011038 [Chlamydomonas incerta]|uniref:Uncharacterized protein n=1 Tax=Chlamydomonas incerta TaxID=51695 RepID=A0A835VXK5_CHLIN|nr:hypothetical protein HXX76_011038 [Chlamydomonas incerta]|eukprot:KAG2429269.1 hypothetical protein HXX76_011038 [Chlamydomonas incerta]